MNTSRILVLLMGIWFTIAAFNSPPLFAQGNKLGLSPEAQKKYDKSVRTARLLETLGYVGIGVGFAVILIAIPIAIYRDRQKKARKRAAQQASTQSLLPDEAKETPG